MGARGYATENTLCPVRRLGKDEEEKDDHPSPSHSFNDVTFATATDAAPEDNTEAPEKDGFEEEALNGTAGGDGLSDTLANPHSYRQININLILKNNLILFLLH